MDGLLDTGSRMLMLRSNEEYHMDESGAEITVTLPGSETGSGFIMDERGIALDDGWRQKSWRRLCIYLQNYKMKLKYKVKMPSLPK